MNASVWQKFITTKARWQHHWSPQRLTAHIMTVPTSQPHRGFSSVSLLAAVQPSRPRDPLDTSHRVKWNQTTAAAPPTSLWENTAKLCQGPVGGVVTQWWTAHTHRWHPPLTPTADTHCGHPLLTPTADTHRWHPPLTPTADTHCWHPPLTPTTDTHCWHPLLTPTADIHCWHPQLTPIADTNCWHPPLTSTVGTHCWHPPLTPIADTHRWHPLQAPTTDTHCWHPLLTHPIITELSQYLYSNKVKNSKWMEILQWKFSSIDIYISQAYVCFIRD